MPYKVTQIPADLHKLYQLYSVYISKKKKKRQQVLDRKVILILLFSCSVGDNIANRTEYYTTAKNLLVSGADAMERLMTAYKVNMVFFGQIKKYST